MTEQQQSPPPATGIPTSPSLLATIARYQEIAILHRAPESWQVSLDGSKWSSVQTTLGEAIGAVERGDFQT